MIENNYIPSPSKTAIDILANLVGFNSVSSLSNLPVIEWIEDYLSEHGVESARIPSPDGTKANLLARIGPVAPGGIVLSGHTDVVPVEGQSWDSDPFVLTERAGKFYGRGTADMKSFIACCLALAPQWVKEPREKPIYLAFSYDEEVGCLGAPYLVQHMVKHISPLPDFVIIGEPTLMQVVTAHKGVLSFETVVHGVEAHSSQPHLGVNAVHIACELVHFLSHLTTEKCDERFTPAHTTIHVGTISGGTARNIIAKECRFLWEIRPLPGEDADAIAKQFHDFCKTFDTKITTTPRSRMLAVSLPEKAETHCQHVMHAACTNHQHAVSFGTEAGVFNDHGIPAIVCGPGAIDQAHKPNEFIEIAQIEACVQFLQKLTVS